MTDTGRSFDMAAAVAKMEAEQAARKRLADEVRPRNKSAILATLATAGIDHVVIVFDGAGDSGQIEDVAAFADGNLVDLPSATVDYVVVAWDGSTVDPRAIGLADAIERACYDLLEETHDGWEINEGAFGEFTFDVIGDAIRLDYNERIETSEHSGHAW